MTQDAWEIIDEEGNYGEMTMRYLMGFTVYDDDGTANCGRTNLVIRRLIAKCCQISGFRRASLPSSTSKLSGAPVRLSHFFRLRQIALYHQHYQVAFRPSYQLD